MERTYRKKYYAKKHQSPEASGWRERLLSQCIVSGVIFACVLTVCVIKLPATMRIRENLKTVLSGATDFSGLSALVSESFDKAVSTYDNLVPESVKTIFGEEEADEKNETPLVDQTLTSPEKSIDSAEVIADDVSADELKTDHTAQPALDELPQSFSDNPGASIAPVDQVRIDEDILKKFESELEALQDQSSPETEK